MEMRARVFMTSHSPGCIPAGVGSAFSIRAAAKRRRKFRKFVLKTLDLNKKLSKLKYADFEEDFLSLKMRKKM